MSRTEVFQRWMKSELIVIDSAYGLHTHSTGLITKEELLLLLVYITHRLMSRNLRNSHKIIWNVL